MYGAKVGAVGVGGTTLAATGVSFGSYVLAGVALILMGVSLYTLTRRRVAKP